MKNQFDIHDYETIKDINSNKKLSFIIVTIFIIIIILILSLYKFSIYEKNSLIKTDNGFSLIVDSKSLNSIETNRKIIINNKEYKYKILSINKDYTNLNNIIYQTIYIKPYNYKTEAIISECYFLKSKKSILENFIGIIKGE